MTESQKKKYIYHQKTQFCLCFSFHKVLAFWKSLQKQLWQNNLLKYFFCPIKPITKSLKILIPIMPPNFLAPNRSIPVSI